MTEWHGPRELPPARPSELLSSILSQYFYPTTLVVCSSRVDFVAALVNDFRANNHDNRRNSAGRELVEPDNDGKGKGKDKEPNEHFSNHAAIHNDQTRAQLLAAPLLQVAVSRHLRVVFVPTVSHLRAFLAVFSPMDPTSKVRPPPLDISRPGVCEPPSLLVYGFLGIHRDTSEWSAQGIGCTAAGLVEAAYRNKFAAVVLEAESPNTADFADGTSEGIAVEEIPVLSGSARRLGQDGESGHWTGKTVPIERVLGRWFRLRGEE